MSITQGVVRPAATIRPIVGHYESGLSPRTNFLGLICRRSDFLLPRRPCYRTRRQAKREIEANGCLSWSRRPFSSVLRRGSCLARQLSTGDKDVTKAAVPRITRRNFCADWSPTRSNEDDMLIPPQAVAALALGFMIAAPLPARADVVLDVSELPLPSGFTNGLALGISDDVHPKIVGYGFGPATGGAYHALLWPDVFTVVDIHPAGVIPCELANLPHPTPGAAYFCAAGAYSIATGIDSAPLSSGARIFGEADIIHCESTAAADYCFSWNNYHAAVLWSEALTWPWNLVDMTPIASGLHSGITYGPGIGYGGSVGGGKQVGWVQPQAANARAFMWAGSSLGAVNLGPADLAAADESYAQATDGNQQVGYVRRSGGGTHAALWEGTLESYVDLHSQNFGAGTVALGVRGGQQVGLGYKNGSHALLWRGTPASVIDLGVGVALATNGSRQVGSSIKGAALWSGTSDSYVDIHVAADLHGTPFLSTSARAINGAGKIVGDGYDSNRNWHPLLWNSVTVVTEPTATPSPAPTMLTTPVATFAPTALSTPVPSPTLAADAASRKCRAAIIAGATTLVRAETKALRKCEEKVLIGKLPVDAACRTEPDTAISIRKIQARFRDAVANACGGKDKMCTPGGNDVPLVNVGWQINSCPGISGGTCTNVIADCADVAACVTCIGESTIDQAMNGYYGAPIADASSAKRRTKCQVAIGSAATTCLIAGSDALGKCWEAVNAGKATGRCPAADGKAVDTLAEAEAKRFAAICKACGGNDKACGGLDDLSPLQIGYMSNCPDVKVPDGQSCAAPIATLQDLVTCVDCVTEFAVECATVAAVPMFATLPRECTP